jgi:hypothetical protein
MNLLFENITNKLVGELNSVGIPNGLKMTTFGDYIYQ